MKFIKTKVKINNTEHDFNFELLKSFRFFGNDVLLKRIISNCLIRHRKDDVEEVELPGYNESIIWLNKQMQKKLI